MKQYIKNKLRSFPYRLVHIDKLKIEIKKDYWGEQRYLEKSEFRYVLWLDRIYQKIISVPGHIVELGVAYGRNAVIFSHLIQMNGEDPLRNYHGFDTFNGYNQESLLNNKNLSSTAWINNSRQQVEGRLKRAGVFKSCRLYEGDIVDTLPNFLSSNPDFRAALLYVDCNAY